ncbi:MAG: hypothetical protein L6R38_006681 [Xanthoria sp. 2 TBL-2021]|nr:MAG: hypothetical protein L6R38_006681 [Xanthoria sp. 2 TBL-2021]
MSGIEAPPASDAGPIEGTSVVEDNVQLDGYATQVELDEAAQEELSEKLRREREARAQALTLEIVGDLPYAEVKPPENVLFVCKLNPVTEDEDLDLIFSRFGNILSCEVIRDKRTGDSLQYAFVEFEDQKACEQAYFKMQGVLIDDHRIHVDFSQSVSRLSDTWRTATNSKRANQSGGFGGVANLEKKRQYRAVDPDGNTRSRKSTGYDMADETGTWTLNQAPAFVQEAAAREGEIIVKIVHRHGVMKGDQGAEVEIRDRGIMVGTGNITRLSVFGVLAIRLAN